MILGQTDDAGRRAGVDGWDSPAPADRKTQTIFPGVCAHLPMKPRRSGVGSYTWTNFKAGTYLLQSGTNPAKQVQMGLYAAVKKDHAPGEAYPANPADLIVMPTPTN